MKESSSGEQLQEDVQHPWQISHPDFLCLSNYPIVNICTNKACEAESALMCDQELCLFCSKNHEICEHIKLKILTKLLKNRFDIKKNFEMEMLKIEDEAIEKLKAGRKILIDKYQWGHLVAENQEMVKSIFIKQESINFRGKSARQLLDSLREMQANDNSASFILSQFSQASANLFQSLSTLRENILSDFCSHRNTKEEKQRQWIVQERKLKQEALQSYKKEILKIDEMPKIKEDCWLDSKIIKKDNVEALSFLFQSLSKPKQMVLIFRASQNQFLAEKFHQACDNVPNTCTLIFNNYSQIIGGYTPLKWNIQKNYYLKDQSQTSFIFSVSLKEKMDLIDPQKAIKNRLNFGPCFGKKDLFIRNKCNSDPRSHASFPRAYNLVSKPYVANSQTTQRFCGSQNGCFKVKQYEVFKVIW